jgi:hypothetical protein
MPSLFIGAPHSRTNLIGSNPLAISQPIGLAFPLRLYLSYLDNITDTNGSGTVKSTIFAYAADYIVSGTWYTAGASSTITTP